MAERLAAKEARPADAANRERLVELGRFANGDAGGRDAKMLMVLPGLDANDASSIVGRDPANVMQSLVQR